MCWLTRFLSVLALVVLVGVLPVRAETNSIDPRDVAARFLDAFYAWDAKALDALLSHNAEGDAPLEGKTGAHEVVSRPPCDVLESGNSLALVTRSVTVNDDFGRALGYRATDTFAGLLRTSGACCIVRGR